MSVYFALLAGAFVPGISSTVRLIKGGTFDGLALFVMTTMLMGVGIAVIAGSPRFLLATEAWVTAVGGAWFLVSARGRRPLAFLFAPPLCLREDGRSRASHGTASGNAWSCATPATHGTAIASTG